MKLIYLNKCMLKTFGTGLKIIYTEKRDDDD